MWIELHRVLRFVLFSCSTTVSFGHIVVSLHSVSPPPQYVMHTFTHLECEGYIRKRTGAVKRGALPYWLTLAATQAVFSGQSVERRVTITLSRCTLCWNYPRQRELVLRSRDSGVLWRSSSTDTRATGLLLQEETLHHLQLWT